MGAGNVKLVYARWADLPHVPFRVLVYMALVSLDEDEPPRFWGGREALAAALGRTVPDGSDEKARKERNAAFKAARDATAVLTKRGALTVVKAARTGQRQEWILNLDRTEVHAERAPKVHAERAQRCTLNVEVVHAERAPKEQQEDPGLTRGTTSARERAGARASARPEESYADFVTAYVDDYRRRFADDQKLSGEGEEFAVSLARDAYVEDALVGIDEMERSTVDGMLEGGAHPKAVVNKILKARGESEADYRDALSCLLLLPDEQRQTYQTAADEHAAAHFPEASQRYRAIYAARLARRAVLGAGR